MALSIVIVSALGVEEVPIEEKPAEEKPQEEEPAPLPAEARFAEVLIGTDKIEYDDFEPYRAAPEAVEVATVASEVAPEVITTEGAVEAPAEGQRAHYYYGQARAYAPQVRSYSASQARAYYYPQRIAYIG